MQYLGIDWGTRRAAWCAIDDGGELREATIAAEQDGLARLVLTVGAEQPVRGCIEMMSGAVWVRDQLASVGWEIRIADARKAKAIAPLACKTDRVDARVLADLVRRDLVPEVWVPSVDERANRERLRRRSHLIRLRTSPRQGQPRQGRGRAQDPDRRLAHPRAPATIQSLRRRMTRGAPVPASSPIRLARRGPQTI